MDPEATWALITSPDTDPAERRDAALNLLVWLAKGGGTGGEPDEDLIADACEAVIIAEFEYADRLAGR